MRSGNPMAPASAGRSHTTRTTFLLVPPAALFHAQSDDGVYARRAACGQVARHQGGGTEHRRHTDKCGRIRWSDFEQEAFEKPRECQGAEPAERHAHQGEGHALAQYHAEDLRRTRANGHAPADFMPALADG